MKNVMNKQLLFNMSDADDILNIFLRAMSKSFEQTAAVLIQTCWNTVYYSIRFCRAHTVFLQKLKKKLYHTQDLIIYCIIQHSEQDYRSSHCTASQTNYRTVSYAIWTTNEYAWELLHRNSSRSLNKSDAHSVRFWRLCDLIACLKHNRNIWSCAMWTSDACAEDQENVCKTCDLNSHLHVRMFHHHNACRDWVREVSDVSRNAARVSFIINFLFVLHCRVARDLQQLSRQIQC